MSRETEVENILLIEDNPGDARLIQEMLSEIRNLVINLTWEKTLETGIMELKKGIHDIVLLDLNLPDSSGFETVARLQKQNINLPVIVLTGLNDSDLAMKIMREGTQDFLVKGQINCLTLESSIRHSITRHKLSTEFIKQNLELQLSRKQFSTIVTNITDGVIVVDRDGGVRFYNPAAEKMLELADKNSLGKRFEYPLHIGGKYEIKVEHKDGLSVIAEVSVVMTEWKKEEMFLASFRDVTARKKAEQQIEENEKWLRHIFDSINAGVVIVDADTRGIVNVNPAAEKIIGCSRDEIVGDMCHKFLCPPGKGTCPVLDMGMDIENSEQFVLKSNGDKVPVLKTVRKSENNGKTCLIESFIDISEIKQAEVRIQKLSNFPESNPNPIIEISDKGEVNYFNSAAADLMYDLGKGNMLEILPPDLREIAMVSLASGKSNRHVDVAFGNRIVSWSFYPISEDNVLHAYGSDITEKLKLEKQLVQSQKMEAVGSLAGGIAHDFNNLLTAIRGYADLALRHLNITDTVYKDVCEIKKAGIRAAKLTRQLLVFSRSEEVKLIPININQTVQSLLKMLTRLIGEDVTIKTSGEEKLWTVKADEGNIEQIIMNLAVNARDAMPDGGLLTIKTSNAIISQEMSEKTSGAYPGKFVCLTVGDTGEGMEPETITRIFEPFFTTKGQGEGTGLGLSMIYGIVKQHGGWIHVDSEPDAGTTFRIYLPIVSSDTFDKKSDMFNFEDLMGGGERILLIEDEDSVREFTSRALIENGYQIFPAADAEEAFQIFENEKGEFALVFSDVILPDGTGPQLVNKMMKTKPDLKVVFGSGYTGTRSQFFYISQEGFTYLQKPYDLAELLLTIKSVINEKEQSDAV